MCGSGRGDCVTIYVVSEATGRERKWSIYGATKTVLSLNVLRIRGAPNNTCSTDPGKGVTLADKGFVYKPLS